MYLPNIYWYLAEEGLSKRYLWIRLDALIFTIRYSQTSGELTWPLNFVLVPKPHGIDFTGFYHDILPLLLSFIEGHYKKQSYKNVWLYWLLGHYWGHRLLHHAVSFYEDSLGKILFNFIIGSNHTFEQFFLLFKILWSLWIMSLILFLFLIWPLDSPAHKLGLWFITSKHPPWTLRRVCVCVYWAHSLSYFSSTHFILSWWLIYCFMQWKFISYSHNC